MTCNFRIGQKVVCVDDAPEEGRAWKGGESPTEGSVYTIRSIHFDNGVQILGFEEIERSDYSKQFWKDQNLGYLARRFRPVVERKTDISIFRALLTPSKEKVETAS